MMRGRNVEKMMPLINEQAQVMVNKWRDNEPKTFQVDLRDPLMGYVNKVIGVAAFGRDFLEVCVCTSVDLQLAHTQS